jgi:uncharacterized RDD family membrane protein YckC
VVALGGVLVIGFTAFNGLLFLADPRGHQFTKATPLLTASSYVLGLVIYLSVAWVTTGKTFGCYVMGLRVVDPSGGSLRSVVAFVRALLCVAFPIGVLLCGTDARRSLQDRVVGTTVIYAWRRGGRP